MSLAVLKNIIMGKDISSILNELISWTSREFHENIEIKNDSREIYIATYFSTQLEYAKAFTTLIEQKNFIAIPPTFRSLFEAHIDLVNLCKHDSYDLVLMGMFLDQKIKEFHTYYKESENPFLPNIPEEGIDLGSEITKMKKQLRTLRNGINRKFGKDIFKIKKRVELADIGETYSGIYSILSSHSHNDLFRVDTRHVERSADDITIHTDGQWDISEVEPPIVTLPGVLIGSLIVMFEKFSIEKEKYLLEKREQIVNQLESELSQYR